MRSVILLPSLFSAANALAVVTSDVGCLANQCYLALTADSSSGSALCSRFLGTSTASAQTVVITTTACSVETITNLNTLYETVVDDETTVFTVIDTETLGSEVDVIVTDFTTTYLQTVTEQPVQTTEVILKRDAPVKHRKRGVCPPKSQTTTDASSIPPLTTTSADSATSYYPPIQHKKRSVCPPKSLTTSTTASTPVSSPTTTALVGPTDVCTNPAQFSSACSCLSVTQAQEMSVTTVYVGLTLTETSYLDETTISTQVVTSVDAIESDIDTTIFYPYTETFTDYAAASSTVTVLQSAPSPSSSTFIMRVIPIRSTVDGDYLIYGTGNSAAGFLDFTGYTADMSSASRWNIASNGQLGESTDSTLFSYLTEEDNVVMTFMGNALLQDYDSQSFALSNPGPYHVGDTGTIVPLNSYYSVAFADCGSAITITSTSSACGRIFSVEYIFV